MVARSMKPPGQEPLALSADARAAEGARVGRIFGLSIAAIYALMLLLYGFGR